MWLLEAHVRQMIENAEASGTVPTLDEQIKFEARYSAEDDDGSPRILKTAGSVGEISIRGIMTKAPSFMAMLFGGGNTTYSEIISAIAVAEQDDSVKELVFAVDSPGGQFDGLFDVLAAMQSMKKPSRAVVDSAQSAAFAIAAQADKIEAVNRAALLGSIGVAVEVGVDENVVTITSTEAPDKRPDPTTEEGKAVFRELLDPMHQLFAESIAEGRGTTVEKVNATFGRGATLLADEALKRGMIDSIAGVSSTKPSIAASEDITREVKAMTLEELKAAHPGAYAAAVAVGNEQGVTQERDRVGAHLTMGAASGDMKTAIGAVNDGSAMTATLQAAYMAAGMNHSNISAAGADDGETAEALAAAKVKTDAASQEATANAALTDAAFAACGVELKEV